MNHEEAWRVATEKDWNKHPYFYSLEAFKRCQKDARMGTLKAIELIRYYTELRMKGTENAAD